MKSHVCFFNDYFVHQSVKESQESVAIEDVWYEVFVCFLIDRSFEIFSVS